MLDWESRPRESVVDLEKYERARQPRRSRKELKLSFEARRGILENERGFTVEEVKQAWSEALKIRKQRQETRQQAPHQRLMDEIYESACRKYNRLVTWQMCNWISSTLHCAALWSPFVLVGGRISIFLLNITTCLWYPLPLLSKTPSKQEQQQPT